MTSLPVKRVFSVPRLFFLVAFISVILARFMLFGFSSQDYNVYLSEWFKHLYDNGFDFKDNFSNYNFPYLYLLWVGTLFTSDSLIVVKVIGLIADVFLAAGAFKIIKHYKNETWAMVAFIILLLIPEVMINSSMWGQADSVFTAFIIWSFYFFIKGRNVTGWVFYALAFSFKIQAIFVLPAILIWFVITKQKFWYPLVGIGVFLATSIPAILGGRSLLHIFDAYRMQIMGDGTNTQLSTNIPNIAVFIDNYAFVPEFKYVMICGTATVVILMTILILHYRERIMGQQFALLKIAVVFAYVIPFLLPSMLDRYFFLANTILVILALLEYKYILMVFISQTVSVMTYTVFLTLNEPVTTNFPVVSLPILTLGQMGNIGLIIWFSFAYLIKEIYSDPDVLEGSWK